MRITPRHLAFVEYYCNPESGTFGNATKSYIKAGFNARKTADKCSCTLVAKTEISKLIEQKNREYKQKRDEKADFDEAFIRSQWLKLLSDCQNDDGEFIDKTNANTCLRAMAQSKAMLTDKIQSEALETPKIDEKEKPLLAELRKAYKEKAATQGLKIG